MAASSSQGIQRLRTHWVRGSVVRLPISTGQRDRTIPSAASHITIARVNILIIFEVVYVGTTEKGDIRMDP